MQRVVLLLVVISFIGCESDETRMSKMADEYCNCFSTVNDMVSMETVKVYEDVLKAIDEEKLGNALEKLDSASRHRVTGEFVRMAELIEDQEQHKCLEQLEGKYGSGITFSDTTKLKELIELLEMRSECRVATLFLKMSYHAAQEKYMLKPD
jgi:hypothetical protein